ncbi:hypothetical protein [Rhizobium sp.]|jgi:hypothetical protein|uniref:hypothetical protein n=1 Tax=Rhizobium sp. TaxID=391 RepID=UPI000E8DB0AE|nr:hypothetical protein [Rhizobium sp.]
MFASSISQHTVSSDLLRDVIAAHPLFPEVERRIAKHLIGIHKENPRLSRLKASHRKWLMTQSLYALAMERTPDDPLSGLTTTRFVETILELGEASRNTAASFLAELVAYKFLTCEDCPADRRMRILLLTKASEKAMTSWFHGHLDCLDFLDQGNRRAISEDNPQIFKVAQPIIAHTLVNDKDWRYPLDSIAPFLNSDMGGMVLHDLISHVPDQSDSEGRYQIGKINLSNLGKTYLISLTNLKRMFKTGHDLRLLGWQQQQRRGGFWLTEQFVKDYYHWQSAKFEVVNSAFWEGVKATSGNSKTIQPRKSLTAVS